MTSIKRLLLVLMCFLAGCLSPPPATGNLSFTTIEQKQDPAYFGQQQYNALTPGLMVFADKDAMADGLVWFSEEARQKARQVDWNTQFAVAVFQGWQSTEGYGVTIEQILLQERNVQIFVNFQEPSSSAASGVTSPYHLVAIRRPLGVLDGFVVELLAGNEILDTYPTPTAP